MRLMAALLLGLSLGACATTPRTAPAPARPPAVTVTLIGINDFHGNLAPPQRAITAPGATFGETVQVPAGGAAYLATAIEAFRARNSNSLVLSAGDMVGASPMMSALFLDEPTILAMNMIRVDYNAVGNHEFDRGAAELQRLANGGCEVHTARTPCAVDPDFPGASFGMLAANTIVEATGQPLFPAYAMRSFGQGESEVKVAIIGLTLEDTPSVVTPAGVAGLSFRDEADTVNALIPRLRAEGADAIVVLIHQGGSTEVGYNDQSCAGLTGEIVPIIERLPDTVDLIISGHTHKAYVCAIERPARGMPILLTSAGQHGTLLTEIQMAIDPVENRVISISAENHIVQGEPFEGPGGTVALSDNYRRYSADPQVAALVQRYAAAAAPLAARPVGRMTGPAERDPDGSDVNVMGNLIADAQLASTREAGAVVAFMNQGGIRADIVPAPDGTVTYGQLFAVQPFANAMTVKSMTGRQIRALLEQQFDSGYNSVTRPNMLTPSRGFSYAYDLSRPSGQRIIDPRLNGAPLEDDRVYRVAMNSFLASGGDNFTVFRDGTDQVGGEQDIDALEAYFRSGPITPPTEARARNVTPAA